MGVLSSSPVLNVEITRKKLKKKKWVQTPGIYWKPGWSLKLGKNADWGEDTKFKMQQNQELKQHNSSGNLCQVHGGRGNLVLVNIPSLELIPPILTLIRLLKWYVWLYEEKTVKANGMG